MSIQERQSELGKYLRKASRDRTIMIYDLFVQEQQVQRDERELRLLEKIEELLGPEADLDEVQRLFPLYPTTHEHGRG